MENKNFENGWKKILDDAEVPPNDTTWSSIESDLLAAENKSMRKTIVLYRRMAAALVLFAFFAGAFSIYVGKQNREKLAGGRVETSRKESLSLKEQTDNKKVMSLDKNSLNPNDKPSITSDQFSNEDNDLNENKDESNVDVTMSSSASHKINNDVSEKKRKLVTSSVTENSKSQQLKILPETLSSLISSENIKEKEKHSGEQTIALLDTAHQIVIANDTTALMAVTSKIDSDQQVKASIPVLGEKVRQSMWISGGGSEGNYNPGLRTQQQASPLPTSSLSTSINTPKRGTFYSIGVSVGRKIFSRWVVQGGLNYLNQNYSYTSSYLVANNNLVGSTKNYTAPTNSYSLSTNRVASISPTRGTSNVSNTLQFISVPVQIGYLVVNQKVSVLLNAGASPNIFIRNSFRDPSGNLRAYSEGPGSKSPYKNVSWYGLLNAEFSYGLWGRYRFSLLPGIRYAMGPSLKSGNDRPSVLDLGFRIRYALR